MKCQYCGDDESVFGGCSPACRNPNACRQRMLEEIERLKRKLDAAYALPLAGTIRDDGAIRWHDHQND